MTLYSNAGATMKRSIMSVAAVLLICGGFAWSQQRPQATTALQRWEYNEISHISFPSLKQTMWAGSIETGAEIPKDAKDPLDLMGKAGWELVTVVADKRQEPEMTTYYFKRPGK
jgi:hypothetical protein